MEEEKNDFKVNQDGTVNCKINLCELFKQMSEAEKEEFINLIIEEINKKELSKVLLNSLNCQHQY